MSFTLIEQAQPRLHRSELAVPGSDPALFEKAAKSKADIIFLDVEDAVAPDDKEQARKNIIAGLNDIDWGTKTMMVRINGLDTHYMYRDVVDIVEACPRLDMILIPKVGVPADVYAIDMLVTQIETAKKRTKRIGFEVLIETALGMANVEAIAQSSKRLEAMSFGVADYAASTRARTTVIGGVNPDYGVLADKDARRQARLFLGRSMARGADAHDGRLPRLWAAADRRAVRRFLRCRWLYRRGAAAPPCSAMKANGRSIRRRSSSPTRSSRRRRRKSRKARRIVEAMQQAAKEGKGAVSLDGTADRHRQHPHGRSAARQSQGDGKIKTSRASWPGLTRP